MRIRFWGVRGSFPVSSPDVIRHGGNTPCVELEAGGRCLIVDAGTGIRGLGRDLVERRVSRIDLLLSHAHWDHIQGFPHFEPLLRPDTAVTVHALRHPRHGLADILAEQQAEPFYPVPLEQLGAQVTFVEHEDGERFQVGDAQITCRRLNHPSVTGGWRVEAEDRTFAYLCDTDVAGQRLLASDLPEDGTPWLEQLRAGARDLGHGADFAVCDTFFLPQEYDPAWGHSCAEDFLELIEQAQASAMYLFHHRPSRTDAELDRMVERLSARASGRFEIVAAREGDEIRL